MAGYNYAALVADFNLIGHPGGEGFFGNRLGLRETAIAAIRADNPLGVYVINFVTHIAFMLRR